MIPYTTYTDLSQQPKVEELILGEIRSGERSTPDYMKIRRFILLYKLLDADDEELTRTGKVRRRFVYGLYLISSRPCTATSRTGGQEHSTLPRRTGGENRDDGSHHRRVERCPAVP